MCHTLLKEDVKPSLVYLIIFFYNLRDIIEICKEKFEEAKNWSLVLKYTTGETLDNRHELESIRWTEPPTLQLCMYL